jgi:hypothetical protein
MLTGSCFSLTNFANAKSSGRPKTEILQSPSGPRCTRAQPYSCCQYIIIYYFITAGMVAERKPCVLGE